jgi:phosphohistidine phosphatase SixA
MHVRSWIFAALLALMPAAAGADDAALAALARPGTQALLRHAIAPGVGDPANFKLGDCATQRNLDDRGRAQAVRIGQRLRNAAIKVDAVLTSQWCRAADTARLLALAPVEDAPELNSFFGNAADNPPQTAAAKRRLAEVATAGRKAVLVKHQVNITALTGANPASGEIVVVSVDPTGRIVVEGTIRTD